MAKVKNKRNAGAADRANQKRKAEANKKKLNPFEVHINREKHHVLGKKSKHDRGLPGVSRAKAVQKRKETLGTEMKLMHKSNTFIDKRIGEKDSGLSAEDRMVARFAAERAKQHGRKNIYNLADDEVLTHRGQTLEQIEKFDDPRSDEEDEAGFKGLDDDFVSEGHFGGGVLSKSDKDGAKSHKDLIEQLIAESKKRKAEKQKEKEQTLDLTEKLDSEWKDLQPVVFKRARVEEESAIDKVLNKAEQNGQDYDKMMRELRFEKRGVPSDAIKTDEKVEREEQERIARLEKERDRRMADQEDSAQQTGKHRSADDLDDNFQLDDEQDFMLAYDKDGKPLVPDHILKANSVPKSNREIDDGVIESSDDDDDEKAKSEDNNEESEEDGESEEEDEESDEGDNDKSDEDNEKSDSDEQKDEKMVNSGKLEKTNKDRGESKQENKNSILFRDSDSSEEEEDSNGSDDEMKGSNETSKSNSKETNISKVKEINVESSDGESSADKEIKSIETLNNSNVIEPLKETKADSDDSSSEAKDVTVNSKINDANVIQNGSSESEVDADETDEDEDEDGDDNNKTEIVKKSETNNKSKTKQDADSEDSSDESETSEVETKVNEKVSKTKKRVKLIGDSDVDEKSEDDGDQLQSFLGKTAEYEKLKKLLSDKTPSQQGTVIEKLIKSYDPSLGENNKEMLSKLFANLLQYVTDLFTNLKTEEQIKQSFCTIEKIAPYFYDINQINKVSSRKLFAELLTEKHNEYKKRVKRIPDLDTLVFFKLISLLYPTSDFRHPITTPSLTFMSEILTTSKFRNAHSISRGMFVTTLILEYTALSQRYVPAAVNFIRGILYLSAKTTVLNPIKVVPPFRLHKDANILNLEDDCSKVNAGWKMELKDLTADTIDNAFKIRTLLNATLMLKEFFDHCNEMTAQECIFEPHIQLLGRLELELYPKKVASTIEGILKYMKDSLEVKTYTSLSSDKPKIKTLRLYEPDIQEVFTGSKSSKLSREMAERQRLQHRYKREMKGALREIRRDKAYIASVKIREKIQSDNIRKDKVKQIYKDASIQQGELNKMKRGK